jgi:CubicO group peptidase (beta-lactamase class C family)
MTLPARFDLASLTKPLVTTALCMRAVCEGRVGLENCLERFFPSSFLPASKRAVTLGHLLNHCSGLPPYRPFFKGLVRFPAPERRGRLLEAILKTPLLATPGKECHYSDLGFILLGMILEDVFGDRLDRLAVRHLHWKGAEGLSFRPLKTSTDPEAAPEAPWDDDAPYVATECCPWRKRLLEGEVHDENAYCLEGVAGHAGLFGTAQAVYRWLRFLWNVARGDSSSPGWLPGIVNRFWEKPGWVPGSTWALGFDTPSPGRSSAGSGFSSRSVGHLGFTGTSFWLDLEQEIVVILLTNRVHPSRENDRLTGFRPLFHDTVMKALHESTKH